MGALMQMAMSETTGNAKQATGKRANRLPKRPIFAAFDAQMTTTDTARLWTNVDGLAMDSLATPSNRKIWRDRCRYERTNNSYLMGICNTVADYVIGTGPKLQMLIPGQKAMNREIELLWSEWAAETRLTEKLRTSRVARFDSGEMFFLQRHNPNLYHPVKIDLAAIESEQVSSPDLHGFGGDERNHDGVIVDESDHPVQYEILRRHPGSTRGLAYGTQADVWAARYVLHDFRPIRPRQYRGVPEVLPAIRVFAEIRQYCEAVIAASETAADYSILIKTGGPPLDPSEDTTAGDFIPVDRRMATVLPQGYDATQLRAEQPTTTYAEFLLQKLREAARLIGIPSMFITMDAQEANMASAYVIMQPFAKAVQADRLHYELLLDRIYDQFITILIRLGKISPDVWTSINRFSHGWRWPSVGQHADPAKVANAQQARIELGISSRSIECASEGKDYEEIEAETAKEFGMTVDELRRAKREKQFGESTAKGDTNESNVANDSKTQQPTEDEVVAQSTSSDLRGTVGGANNIVELQKLYHSGQIAREMCIANAQLFYGFTREQAELLFPILNNQNTTTQGDEV